MLERDNEVSRFPDKICQIWEIPECSALTNVTYTISFKQTVKKYPHQISNIPTPCQT